MSRDRMRALVTLTLSPLKRTYREPLAELT